MKILLSYGDSGACGVHFNWTNFLEPVILSTFQCDSKKRCGCDRAFTGIVSRKGTTRAIVVEIPVTRRQLIDACVQSNHVAYPGVQGMGPIWSRESAVKLIELVQEQRVGTIVALKLVRHQPKLVRLGETIDMGDDNSYIYLTFPKGYEAIEKALKKLPKSELTVSWTEDE